MTIDERLERLTERHEALAQSMELFQHEMAEMRAAAAQRDAITDARIGRILDLLEQQASNLEQQARNIEQQAANIEKQAGNIDKLAAIAQDHQRRIDRLES